MRKIISKLVALSLCVALLCSIALPSFAIENNGLMNIELDQYIQHPYVPEMTSTLARTVSTEAKETAYIDGAIDFVKSLNLKDQGYGYIEEQCLAELEEFRSDDRELLSYTVLTPKTTAAETVLGTYSGKTFYYTLTSIANHSKSTTDTVTSTGSTWGNFTLGLISLIVSLPDVIGTSITESVVSITYSLFCSALGFSNYDIKIGAYFEHKATYDTYCRNIYAYTTSGAERVSYRDYTGIADLKVSYYHMDPANFPAEDDSITIKTKNDLPVQSANYQNTSSILKKAYTYFNRGEVCVDALIENPESYWE